MVLEFLTTWMAANARVSIIISAGVITFLSSLITKWLTNQEHLHNLKKRQKELQEELKKCKNDECKMKEIQTEMLKITGVMMKSSFKPLLVTFIPFLLLLYWLRAFYAPILSAWFWYYLGAGIISSIIFRKLLKMA